MRGREREGTGKVWGGSLNWLTLSLSLPTTLLTSIACKVRTRSSQCNCVQHLSAVKLFSLSLSAPPPTHPTPFPKLFWSFRFADTTASRKGQVTERKHVTYHGLRKGYVLSLPTTRTLQFPLWHFTASTTLDFSLAKLCTGVKYFRLDRLSFIISRPVKRGHMKAKSSPVNDRKIIRDKCTFSEDYILFTSSRYPPSPPPPIPPSQAPVHLSRNKIILQNLEYET